MKPLLYPLVCLALALGAATAQAASYEDRLIAHLRKLGYGDITLSFTLLGRAQIIAVSKGDTREIVLNPRTGEILRDFAQTIESDGVEAVAIAVEPIVLGPETAVVTEVPLVAAELPLVVEPEIVPGVPEELITGYMEAAPPEAVAPEVPDPTTPETSTPEADTTPTGSPSESTETPDTGTAP